MNKREVIKTTELTERDVKLIKRAMVKDNYRINDYILYELIETRGEDATYIPKDKLADGGIYVCDARNFIFGIWNGEGFEYIRYKMGQTCYFQDVEYHYDDGAPYGTVKPIYRVF